MIRPLPLPYRRSSNFKRTGKARTHPIISLTIGGENLHINGLMMQRRQAQAEDAPSTHENLNHLVYEHRISQPGRQSGSICSQDSARTPSSCCPRDAVFPIHFIEASYRRSLTTAPLETSSYKFTKTPYIFYDSIHSTEGDVFGTAQGGLIRTHARVFSQQ